MLKRLALRRFVFIEEAEAEFEGGFCALTGETGAGKSLLVDALALLAGARPVPGMVKAGADDFEIEAAFSIAGNDALRAFLRDLALDGNEDEMIVRRIAGARKLAFINGRRFPQSALSEAMSAAVEICGQHNHYSLRKPAAQRAFLDSFGGAEEEARTVRREHQRWVAAESALKEAESDAESAARRRAELEAQVAELQTLGFSVEKWEQDNLDLTRLANIDDIAAACSDSLRLLEDKAGEGLSGARRLLKEAMKSDPGLAEAAKCIDQAEAAAGEAVRVLSLHSAGVTADPERRAAAENFIAAAHHLARKHRLPDPGKIGEFLEEKESELAALDAGGGLEALRKEEENARAAFGAACATLTKKRKSAAKRLEKEVSAMLRQLAMPDATFEARLEKLAEAGAGGAERADFHVSARKDVPPGPLANTASGGELSRLGLALQIAAGGGRAAPVFVFDEVDSGVGGATAAIVGALLQRLGESRQVLCVTHLAQVAAHADSHWKVGGDAHVQKLSDQARIDEIARIVGGEVVGDAARANAADLLKQSQRKSGAGAAHGKQAP